jgi:KDO2-lipid IV(A) lauroyltransferase
VPEGIGRRSFDRVGRLACATMPGMRAIVAANQARVLGLPADHRLVAAATREAFALYARYWFDSFHAVRLSDEEVMRRFRCEGFEHVEQALADGTGAILALPHIGNWDTAGRWMKALGHPVAAVAEDLRPERLFRLFVQHREQLGMQVVGLGEAGVGRRIADVLRANGLVALVSDRDFGGRGIDVEMFGARRTMPAGPALLAITTGAALIVAPVYQEADGWRCVMSAPLRVEPSGDRKRDVVALTRLMAERFEQAIAAAPSDWHMFQPAWPA